MADNSVYFTKEYNIAADDLFIICVDTFENIKKGNITKGDAHMGKIEAFVGNRMFGRPAKFILSVTPIDRFNSSLSVETYESNPYGTRNPLGSKGKAEKDMTKFVDELEKRIERFLLKYG